MIQNQIDERNKDGSHIRRVATRSYVVKDDHDYPHFRFVHSVEIAFDFTITIRVIYCHYRRLEVRYPGAVPQRLYEFVYAGSGLTHSTS